MTERPLTKNIDMTRPPLSIADYESNDGYQSIRNIAKGMSPSDVLQKTKDSGLKGRGGAGFPTGLKWSFVPQGDDTPKQKYFVVNADEMEPGTFKDRLLMEGDPHLLIEGIIIYNHKKITTFLMKIWLNYKKTMLTISWPLFL